MDVAHQNILVKDILGNVLKVVAFDAALESINIDLSSLMEGCYFITDDRNSPVVRVILK